MIEQFEARLTAVDHAILAPLVRQVLQYPEFEIGDWRYELLHGGLGQEVSGVYGVYRFSGHALAQGVMLPWSLILKASGKATSGNATTAWNYWKREALVYQSGLLATLPPTLAAPLCWGVVEPSDEEIWVWLEDIPQATAERWTLADYGLAARHLGHFNGEYLAGRDLPRYPWLTQRAFPDWLPSLAPYLSDLDRWRSQPLVQRALPADLVPRMAALWAEHARLLAALERLPRCFCHHDAFRRNLIARRDAAGQAQTVAIDWAFAGTGVVGTEAAKLCTASISFLDVSVAQAQELNATVFAGYLDGLQAAGWRGEPEVVRCGYAIAAALQGLEQLARDLQGLDAGVPDAVIERIFGHTIPQVLDQHAQLFRVTLALADEARTLLGKLKNQ